VTGLIATLLSIAVLASFALIGAGGWMFVKGRNRKQGLLMLLAAFILLVNVLIWVAPVAPA
jgi:hypothetical protein